MRLLRLLPILSLSGFLAFASAHAQFIQQASVAQDGSQGMDDQGDAPDTTGAVISGDGNYVAFASDAANLVANDTGTTSDSPNVFIRKQSDGSIQKVSVMADGTEFPNGEFGRRVAVLAVSETGQFVVFAEGEDGEDDVILDYYEKDLNSGAVVHIPAGFDDSHFFTFPAAAVSADGRIILFNSNSKTLFPASTGSTTAAFVFDTTTNQTTAVSTQMGKTTPVALSLFASRSIGLTSDGHTAIFCSAIKDIVTGQKSAASGYFLCDLTSSAITYLAKPNSTTPVDATGVVISANGMYAAFTTVDPLASSDANLLPDVYVENLQTKALTRASLTASGGECNGASDVCAVSNDGHFVLFTSTATNIVPGASGADMLYLRDLAAGRTTKVNITSSGSGDTAAAFGSSTVTQTASDDGSKVAFISFAPLVPATTNTFGEAYVYTLPPTSDPVPVITIQTPAASSVLQLGGQYSVTGQVAVSSGRTILNEFIYAGPDLVGTSTDASYNLVLSPTKAGSYNITVVAYDDLGAVTIVSEPITVQANYGTGASYAGLLAPRDVEFDVPGGGLVTASVLSTGAFTGKVVLNGASYTLRGTFQPDGSYNKKFVSGSTTVQVVLQYIFIAPDTHADRISVTATQTKKTRAGSTSEIFVGNPERLEANLSETVPVGTYTLVFPPDRGQDPSSVPQGAGYAVMRVSASGSYQLGGYLANNTPLALRGNLTRGAILPICLPKAQGAGVFQGTMQFRDMPGSSDLDGNLRWQTPAKAGLYPHGFDSTLAAVGSIFTAPPFGQLPLNLATGSGNCEVLLQNGGLTTPLSLYGTFAAPAVAGGVTTILPGASNPARITAKIGKTTIDTKFVPSVGPGLLTGSFFDPQLKRTVSFKGVLFQKQNGAVGYFVGKAAVGAVLFGKPQYNTHADATGLPLTIPLNDANGATASLPVTSLGKSLTSVEVSFSITEGDFFDDVTVTLISPSGTMVLVYDTFDNGDFSGTASLDQASVDGFASEDPNGTWTLNITDENGLSTSSATLDSWSLDLVSQ